MARQKRKAPDNQVVLKSFVCSHAKLETPGFSPGRRSLDTRSMVVLFALRLYNGVLPIEPFGNPNMMGGKAKPEDS